MHASYSVRLFISHYWPFPAWLQISGGFILDFTVRESNKQK